MIKAVIFDCFGVLALRGTLSFSKIHYPDNQEKLARHKELEDKMNRGQISYDDFISGLAENAEIDRSEVVKYTEEYKPNKKLLEYISSELKPKYKIGMISNAGADWILDLFGEDKRLFDDIILSYKVGFIKPDPQIYQMSAKNLTVDEEECIFIDDILIYCQGAEAVGMSTVWYQDFNQAQAELEKILPPVPNN